MKPFKYVTTDAAKSAAGLLGKSFGEAKVIGAGTDLVAEMKERIEKPDRLIDFSAAPGYRTIAFDAKKGLTLGPGATLAAIAVDKNILKHYTVLAQAADSAATPQIRSRATLAGNLCQRPRCWYYRHRDLTCLKRGGFTCYSVQGDNRYHAIFGKGPCHIVHPSDPAVALLALGASVEITGPKKSKSVEMEKFFVMPDKNFSRENVLEPNEVVSKITIPAPKAGTKSAYVKFKERDSQDFALVSAAVVLTPKGGKFTARAALGGVAPVPWRAKEAETVLAAAAITEKTAAGAADAELEKAKPMKQNGYKVKLTKTILKRAILAAKGNG